MRCPDIASAIDITKADKSGFCHFPAIRLIFPVAVKSAKRVFTDNRNFSSCPTTTSLIIIIYDRNFFENEILQTLPAIDDQDAVFDELSKIRARIVAGDAEDNLEVSFNGFFGKFGLSSSDKILEAKIADMTRRENDALIAKLYGLEKPDMAVILETFSVMNARFPGYGPALLELLDG